MATKLAGFPPLTNYLFIQETGDEPGSTDNPVIVHDSTVFTNEFGEAEHQALLTADYFVRVTVERLVADWTRIAC